MARRDRDRLVVWRNLKAKRIRQTEAAELVITTRQVRRLLDRYKEAGDRAMVHGLRGHRMLSPPNVVILRQSTRRNPETWFGCWSVITRALQASTDRWRRNHTQHGYRYRMIHYRSSPSGSWQKGCHQWLSKCSCLRSPPRSRWDRS